MAWLCWNEENEEMQVLLTATFLHAPFFLTQLQVVNAEVYVWVVELKPTNKPQ